MSLFFKARKHLLFAGNAYFLLKEGGWIRYNISMPIDFVSALNSSQYEAVTTTAQHVRVIAGAGSGKTRALTYRIAYLLDEMGVDPYRILAVTFTNKAASEMKERVAKLVQTDSQFLTVSTFHSFCARFLRSEAYCIGFPPSFTIFDDEDQDKLLKNIGTEFGYKKGDEMIKAAKAFISNQKTKGCYPDNVVLSVRSSVIQENCLKFYQRYEEEKSRQFALDFDDLILQTLYILQNFDNVRAKWQSRYQHILVDEFQDTNDVQYQLIQLLSRPETCLYVVGDPDQTIYTWRGANQGIILDFPVRFPDAKDIILSRNYRSTKNILNAANRLISYNKKRVPKDLFTEGEEGPAVFGKRFDQPQDEASWVVSKVAEIAGEGRSLMDFRYDNIAILYRSSYMTRAIEAELAANRIPYRIYGGLRFYQRKEVKDVFAYFRLLVNEKDDVAFERIINVPRRGIGETSQARIRDAATKLGVSQYVYLRDHVEDRPFDLSNAVIAKIKPVIQKMEETKHRLSEKMEVLAAVLRDFITDIGYYEFIKEDEGIDEDRAGNVNAIFDDLLHFSESNPEAGIDEYLQNISLLTSQDDMNGGNCVSLMTIHVAKGLEFDNVFIVCMNSGAFPSARAVAETSRDGIEEERRLAYVAMTRAKKRLFMTTNSGYSYVSQSNAVPSPYFHEAGVKLEEPMPKKNPSFPSYFSNTNSNTFGSRKVYGESPSHSSDAPRMSPVNPAGNNGVTDWKVGDAAHHEKFGDGTVVQIIDSHMVVVDFESVGKKTLLASHRFLTKKHSKGGLA